MLDYIRDGQEIYRRSFATIRAEADLAAIPADLEKLAVRIIHACGMVDVDRRPAVFAGRGCGRPRGTGIRRPDSLRPRMVAEGITRARLPANNA